MDDAVAKHYYLSGQGGVVTQASADLAVERGAFTLSRSEVKVWDLTLAASDSEVSDFRAVLSSEELQRAHRFRFEEHARRFIIGRGQLRHVLGACLGVPPAILVFNYGSAGKPALKSPHDWLHFNLSHSREFGLLAVAKTGPVGVDIEEVRPLPEMDALVSRFFSPSEQARFSPLPPATKPGAFFNLWTRKEAFLKATGEGIAERLNRVEVSFLPGEPAAFRGCAAFDAGRSWTLRALQAPHGFAAALVASFRITEVNRFRWNESYA